MHHHTPPKPAFHSSTTLQECARQLWAVWTLTVCPWSGTSRERRDRRLEKGRLTSVCKFSQQLWGRVHSSYTVILTTCYPQHRHSGRIKGKRLIGETPQTWHICTCPSSSFWYLFFLFPKLPEPRNSSPVNTWGMWLTAVLVSVLTPWVTTLCHHKGLMNVNTWDISSSPLGWYLPMGLFLFGWFLFFFETGILCVVQAVLELLC